MPTALGSDRARAAKIAFTKANNAYEAARDARIAFDNEHRTLPYVEDGDTGEWAEAARKLIAEKAALDAAEDAAWKVAHAVYKSASAVTYVKSWHFSEHNPTRDLIAANID